MYQNLTTPFPPAHVPSPATAPNGYVLSVLDKKFVLAAASGGSAPALGGEALASPSNVMTVDLTSVPITDAEYIRVNFEFEVDGACGVQLLLNGDVDGTGYYVNGVASTAVITNLVGAGSQCAGGVQVYPSANSGGNLYCFGVGDVWNPTTAVGDASVKWFKSITGLAGITQIQLKTTANNFKAGSSMSVVSLGGMGAPGPDGAQGPDGDPGADGAPGGADGAPGADGQRGTRVATGNGAPSTIGDEITGDLYLDITGYYVYRWNGSSYANLGGYAGPTGATGAAGAQGDPGPAGADGAPGAAGADGAPGADGADGAPGLGYVATSASALAIAAASKVFTLDQASTAYSVGARVRAASAATPANFMEGVVTAYSGTTLTVLVDTIGGSGTPADWNINLAGEPGADGAGGGGSSIYGYGTVWVHPGHPDATDTANDGTVPFLTVQAAVDKCVAESWTRVLVEHGNYDENVVVPSGLVVIESNTPGGHYAQAQRAIIDSVTVGVANTSSATVTLIGLHLTRANTALAILDPDSAGFFTNAVIAKNCLFTNTASGSGDYAVTIAPGSASFGGAFNSFYADNCTFTSSGSAHDVYNQASFTAKNCAVGRLFSDASTGVYVRAENSTLTKFSGTKTGAKFINCEFIGSGAPVLAFANTSAITCTLDRCLINCTNSGDEFVTVSSGAVRLNWYGSELTNAANNWPALVTLDFPVGKLVMVKRLVGINLKTVAETDAYTPFSGREFIPAFAHVTLTTATALTAPATCGVGVASGADDMFASQPLTGLTATGVTFSLVGSQAGLIKKCAAGSTVKFGVDAAAAGTTATANIELWGYLSNG